MLKKFISYYKKHLKLLIFVLVVVVFSTIMEVLLPMFSRTMLNDYIPHQDVDGVIRISCFMLIAIILYTVSQYIIMFFGHMLGTQIEKDMRMQAFDKLQKLPFAYFDKNKTGVIMARLTTDLHQVAELAHHGVEELLAVSLMLISGYVYLLNINVIMTNILFLITFILLFSLFFSRRNMTKAFRKLRAEHAEINSSLEGAVSGIRLTRAFANEQYEVDKFEISNNKYIDAYKVAYHTLATTGSFNGFFSQALNVTVLLLGTFLILANAITIGDLFTYFIYVNLIISPIKRLITMLETFQQGWAGFERFQTIMDEPITIAQPEHPVVLQNPQGEIIFEQVAFQYTSKSSSVLKHFDLHIPAGKMVALVGPSGVGKTTIAQLIPRFYEITAGQLLIDGVDVRKYDLQSLRSNIGYVQQDVIIFWGTIYENIAYGNPNAEAADVYAAAKAAGIDEFIESLPEQYDTMVGERGVMLSGGQKQRISLARIFLKNPKILILDEATSALDNITEAFIQQSIEKLTVGRTVVVVAHRLSTVQAADEIVVLDETGVVQRGRHEQLLSQDGHYKKLYEASQNGIIAE